MRNKYPGVCYYCHQRVEKNAGHFEKKAGKWQVIHAECVLKQREEKKANG